MKGQLSPQCLGAAGQPLASCWRSARCPGDSKRPGTPDGLKLHQEPEQSHGSKTLSKGVSVCSEFKAKSFLCVWTSHGSSTGGAFGKELLLESLKFFLPG